MPNGKMRRPYEDFGPHKYANHDGTSNCEHDCGCWMGSARSGGPLGINPFDKCPNNPKNGVLQEEKKDYKDCVEGRIQELEKIRCEFLRLKRIFKEAKEGSKISLVRQLREEQEKSRLLEELIRGLNKALHSSQKTIYEGLRLAARR